MANEDKRRHPRAYIRIPVQCKGRNYWQYVEARDISAEGMFVAGEQLEPVGTKLEVMFELPESNRKYVRSDAVVMWVRQKPQTDAAGNVLVSGMGLKFSAALPLTAREYIEHAVSRNMPQRG